MKVEIRILEKMIILIIILFFVFGLDVSISGKELNIVVKFVIMIGCRCCVVVCLSVYLNFILVFCSWFVNLIIRILFFVVSLISIIKLIWLYILIVILLKNRLI